MNDANDDDDDVVMMTTRRRERMNAQFDYSAIN